MRVFKHPEQMTPGSIWKVKGMKGLRYLEGQYAIGCNYRGWQTRWTYSAAIGGIAPMPQPELDFWLDEHYMLIDFNRSENGWIVAVFLSTEQRIVSIDMYELFWDRAFRLAKRSSHPKKVERLLFGKYKLEDVKKTLGME